MSEHGDREDGCQQILTASTIVNKTSRRRFFIERLFELADQFTPEIPQPGLIAVNPRQRTADFHRFNPQARRQ
jgi:hypothetical protein